MKDEMWASAIKLHLAVVFSFIVRTHYWQEKVPMTLNHHSLLLIVSLISLIILSVTRKSSLTIIGFLFLIQVALTCFASYLNHNYYVRNYEVFQPYLGIKLMALMIAFLAPPIRWVGWTSLLMLTLVVLIQYYGWPLQYRFELGIQEPATTFCFIIVAGIFYYHKPNAISHSRKRTLHN